MADKSRVLIITHDLEIGGLQRVVVNICKTINRENFIPQVLCMRALGKFVPEVEELGIKVELLPQTKSGVDYLAFLKIAKIIRRDKIDIIHTHNTQPFIDGTIAAILCGRRKLVHTDHARPFPDKIRYMVAEWFMSLFAKKIVGVSSPTTQNLHKYEKIPLKKLTTITNGIDETSLINAKKSSHLLKELGVKNSGIIFGLIARLSTPKGIPYLLDAMVEVVKHLPTSTLLMVGEGELELELKEKAEQLNLSDNVIFTGPRTDIAMLLKLFDVFVLSSISEGLPMVLLEAMAAHCPIIATDVGGNSTAICNNINGILIPSHSSKALSDAMLKLSKDKNLQNQFADAGYDLFIKKFSAKIMTSAYEKLYLS